MEELYPQSKIINITEVKNWRKGPFKGVHSEWSNTAGYVDWLITEVETQIAMMVHMAKTVDQYAAEAKKLRIENTELREQIESWEADNYNRQIGDADE